MVARVIFGFVFAEATIILILPIPQNQQAGNHATQMRKMGNIIPANSNLIFEIELYDVKTRD